MKMKLKGLLCMILLLPLCLNIPVYASQNGIQDSEEPIFYEITVGDKVVTLEEGEKVVLDMELIDSPYAVLSRASSQTINGSAGRLSVWGSGKYFYWSMLMWFPATHFTGTVSLMDLTSGLSGGSPKVSGFTGSCPTRGLSGHTYSGSLSGTAWVGTQAIARPCTNYITWKP